MTTGPPQAVPTGRNPERMPRRLASVRVKILTWVLVLTALGMITALGVTYVIENQRVRAAIDIELTQEVEEFRQLAENGIDPATGEAFTSVEQLLRVTLQRNVPGTFESFSTFLGGELQEVREGQHPFEVADEPGVMDVVEAMADTGSVLFHTVASPQGEGRLAVVQVGVEGRDAAGLYVISHNVQARLGELFDMMRIFALVSLATLLVVGVAGWIVTGYLMRPLKQLRDNATSLTESDLSARIPVRGDDDISDLAITYNAMLDRIESSFASQREFLDDAGHELRTPLTILSGHLEILDPSDEEAVAETRALLIDEVDRMSRPVEDLILLAKARRPDFIQTEVVDLADLTDNVLTKARGLGDRQWRLDDLADARTEADPQRLTQALLQLCHNAVKFSERGSSVALGSSIDGDHARLWVRDQGLGVNEGEAERLLDRFSRGDIGGAVEGSGLGLAIVDAIATAHGGRVEIKGTKGVGSRFTIVIPLVGADHATDETFAVTAPAPATATATATAAAAAAPQDSAGTPDDPDSTPYVNSRTDLDDLDDLMDQGAHRR